MLKNFLIEMRRRGVFPVIASYAVVGWVLLQVLSIIPQALGMSNWLLTLATVLYLAFFPVVIFISWYFDITLDGISLTPSVDGSGNNKIHKRHWLGFSFTLMLSTLFGLYGYQYANTNLQTSDKQIASLNLSPSIAVLPFIDRSEKADQGFLAAGIAEEITNQLGLYREITVASSFSSAAIAEKYSDPVVIAKQLNVATLLTGTVHATGSRLRVRIELLEAERGTAIYQKSFSRKLIDVFDIEEEISRTIVNMLQNVYFEEGQVSVKSRTSSSDAFILYLQGKEKLKQRTVESIQAARKLFEQAVALDPEYAIAHVGLAQSILLLANNDEGYGVLDVDVALTLAKRNLEDAFTRSPDLAEAHATMGRTLALAHEHEKALPFFEKAIVENPSYADAHHWKYLSLKALNNFDSAYQALLLALNLDPAQAVLMHNYANLLIEQGKPNQAKEWFQKIEELHPDLPWGNRGLAGLAFSNGDLAQTAIQWHKALKKSPSSEQYRTNLISTLFQVQATELAKKFIKSEDWDVNVLISEQKYEQVHQKMAFKLKANPNDKWLMFEAAWYHYLYGDAEQGAELLVNAYSLFDKQELFYPPMCDPAIEIAYAFHYKNAVGQANELIDGCKKLLDATNASGQENASHLYLQARIAAIEGRKTDAIDAFLQAYQSGWREHWTAHDVLIKDILNDERVKPLIQAIETDLLEARQEIEASFAN